MSDSIKVAIKIRPLIKREKEENLLVQWSTQGNTIVATDAELRKRADGGFEFDHIFDMYASNNNVFDNVVRPIVNAAVNGFNGTVFAYGQTSSGKTYTMMGTSEEPGIIPLAIEHMFDAIANTPGREFLLRVSYLEIYNEKVNDLLNKNLTDLKIHEDINGQVFVKCKEEVTNCPENVLLIMNKGNKNRRIGETNMNERSSRSHTIFRITIESREAGAGSEGAIQVSQLNMVDLAGSERARQTGATGERFKEGRHINLSLSTLGLVIKQLSESDSQKYINFRDSKLTRLLQASLGGNAMTVMICAVTPAALDETQCTLSFAARARNVKNKPELNEVMSDGVLLKRYAKQIDKLHAELERVKQMTDFQEMESKMQEKDRINENLEERIRLLQTRIVTASNRNSTILLKNKEKRRQTWCGTGGFNKFNASHSLLHVSTNLSPIKEMSPMKSHNRKSTDTRDFMNTSFQIAFTDFELELINSEANRDEDNDSDEDTFVTYRKQNRVKFTDDVIIHKSPTTYDNDSVTSEKIDMSTQTASYESPGTPKQTLRDRIRNLTEEYSELKEFTTLEKQLHVEDKFSEYQKKLTQFSQLEKQLENITSDKDSFEHIASELRKKLTAAELRYALAEDQLNAQAAELQKVPDLEKKVAQLSSQKIDSQSVPELHKQIILLTAEKDGFEHVTCEQRKKLNEAEQRIILLEDELASRNVDAEKLLVQASSNNETSSEQDELQCKITDLQKKLTEAELSNNSMKDKLENEQHMLQNLQEEKNALACEMQNKLRDAEEINNSIKDKLNEQQIEIQKFQDQEKQIEQLKSENHKFKLTIDELQEQLIETKIIISAKENEVLEQQQNLDTFHLEDIIKEKMEFERVNSELRGQLKEAELKNESIKNIIDAHELKKTCDLENQVEILAIQKNEIKGIVSELEEKLRDVELENNSLRDKLNEASRYETDSLENTNKTLTSENQSEQIIFELQEKLKEAELYSNSMKEESNLCQAEAQKTIGEYRKSIESFAVERSKLEETVCELQEKSKEQEQDNNLMKDKINEYELQLQKRRVMEKEIECLMSKTEELESTVHELREKLADAQNSSFLSARNESNGEQLQKIQLDAQMASPIAKRDEPDFVILDKQSSRLGKELTENQSSGENNYLKGHVNDLEGIIQDVQNENTYLKEQATKSISDNEYDLSNGDSSKIIDDLSITRMSLDEDSAKLSADLVLKNQELDEIKHDVQSLKADIENLQKTIYLLTTENSELTNKLLAGKECNEKLAVQYQQTIDELYARNSKMTDEKLELENNLTNLNEQLETLRSSIPEMNLNEEQIIHKYEKQIDTYKTKNTELSSDLAGKMKEIEMLKESKSLLYEHDCIYKDKLSDLVEKHKDLTFENNELSTDLMDKIEENDGLRHECEILKSKLELSLKNKESIGNNDAEDLKTENTLLKTELMELKMNVKVLTGENSKMSSQIEAIEDLHNAQMSNSCNNTMHLSTLFNNTSVNDAMSESMLDDNAKTKIFNLQEEVNYVTNLNKKLSDLKLSTCTQCVQMDKLNEDRRLLKLEVKTLTHKLENMHRKFNSESAKSEALIQKAKEDVNVSVCNISFNASFSENMNISYAEERLQSLNNELQILKEDHNKLSDLYKEKCNEVEELQNSTITDSTSTDVNTIKKSPGRTLTRLENIGKVVNILQHDLKNIREDNDKIKLDLSKFINEKESLLYEINTLKIANDELLQRLSESESLNTTLLDKADILENEVKDVTKKLQEITVRYKEIENAKLLLEVEAESLKEDKAMKEQTANELRQSYSCLEHELDLIKKEKEALNNDIVLLEQEYKEKLQSLKATNEQLISSKAIISQEFANYSKESENRLTELNERVNKCTSENDYLKQELIKLRNIEDKFEKVKTECQSKSQQDKTLADDNKKLKNILNDTSKNIVKEIKSLKPKVDDQEFVDKSVDELFQIFVETILTKEKEIVKTMRDLFNKEKQKLQDEMRQSVDAEKRMSLWVKELECEIDKLQRDLSEREIASEGLQKEIARLKNLLEESDRDKEVLREKNSLFETDLNNLQIEYNKYSKIDTVNEEAVITAQKRERQAQETIRNKETEFQKRLKSEKEAYNKRIEELTCTIDSFKTKNLELTSNIEGFEANQKQLKNIIDLKSNELMKNNQILQKMQTEFEQLTETCNDLHKELEEKELRIVEIKELLKTKCDELTEYKVNLETIVPENKLLKQQANERKASIEQYRMEIETLKMVNKKKIDTIKDKLNFEELKSAELNNQIAELNSKNVALTEEMNTLKDDYVTIQRKCATLERRVRNSTSKVQAEEQMEELKDLNRSLRNNLDGASNRITELQTAKTDLMKQLVVLNSQYDAACKDNEELKEALSSHKSRHNDTYTACEKYDDLLQEKNKIALELEATKVQLKQKNKDIENYMSEIKVLTEKNVELDQESEELANIIREHDAENARIQDRYYTCSVEIDELRDKIKILEGKKPNHLYKSQSMQTTSVPSSDRAEKSHDGECSCMTLNNKIRELQMELVSRNGRIATLELQIRSGSFPYQTKCIELQEHLSACTNKNSELKAEIKRLQMYMVRTSAKECDVCKQRLVNRKHQSCQTMPDNLLRFCSTSSGVIDDNIRITKLEKEKQLMRDVCRSRSRTIKELEKQIEEYEKLLHSKNA